ncbi:MAG: transporter [Melioribacteraceae bacterium]|nr:MAG: transporter [Melioribacteraceae bacterium]
MKILLSILLISSFYGANLELTDPWIRPAATGMNTAFFVTIENTSELPDTLVNAFSDVSEVVEVHETYTTENDMMGMRHVEMIEVPAEGQLLLKPRSYHVMLIKLKENMKVGEKHKVTLEFKHAGKIEVEAVVRDMPKKHKKMDHKSHH